MLDKQVFHERLLQGYLLTDGAMGTLLHAKGVDIDACFDELNLSQPELIQEIHSNYIDAGAELIECNTFGANRFKLAEHNLDNRIGEINQAGVTAARQAVAASGRQDILVAAAVGPLGVRLTPFGRVTPEQAYSAFREQIEAICEANADLVIFETFSDLYELQEAVRAARDVCETMPVVAQMTFTRDDRTLLGDSPAHVARTLTEARVDVVGVNCSNGPAQIIRIVSAMKAAVPDMIFSAVPNAGWPEYVGGRVIYTATADYFGDFAAAMRDLDIRVVGGCCGTTPQHIASMRAALDNPAHPALLIEGLRETESVESAGEMPPPSKLAEKFQRGDFVIAVEVSPPKGIAANKILSAADLLYATGADVIDVTDSPMARMRMSPWAVCQLIQTQVGIETVLHFPTRGRNLLRVQGDLLAAHALGIRNLFVVMGDPTHIGDYPDAADNYDVVPSGLVRLIKKNLNEGQDRAGNPIGQPTNYLVSSALNLNAADPEHEIRVLRKKIDNGADYLISQPIYDMAIYERFIEQYEAQHGQLEIPLLLGVLPLYSIRHARFLHHEVPGIDIPEPIMVRIEQAGDAAPQEGVRISLELITTARERVAGLYFMPQFGRYDLVAEMIEAVRTG